MVLKYLRSSGLQARFFICSWRLRFWIFTVSLCLPGLSFDEPAGLHAARANYGFQPRERPPINFVVSAPAETNIVAPDSRFLPLVAAGLGSQAAPRSEEPRAAEGAARVGANPRGLVGQKSLAEGDRLRLEGKEDSLRRALDQYKSAGRAFRNAGDQTEYFTSLIKSAEVLNLLGQPLKALDRYREALRIAPKTIDDKTRCQTLINIGVAYSTVGKPQEAVAFYRQALDLSRQIHAAYEEATSLNNLGEAFYDLSELKNALDYLGQSLKIWNSLGDQSRQAKVLKYLGYVHTDLSELPQALSYYQQSIRLYQETHDTRGEAETTNAIGLVYALLGERENAIEHYAKAERIFRAENDRRGLITALNGRGAMYAAIGSARAIECHNEALQLSREVGDLQGQIVALRYLGNVYRALGDSSGPGAAEYYSQAISRHHEALALVRILKDRRIEAYILQDLGSVSILLGDQPRAVQYYTQALALSRRTNDRRGQAASLDSLGRIAEKLRQDKQAADYFKQALALTRAAGDRARESLTLAHLAHLERNSNDLHQAKRNIEEAIEIVETLRTKVLSQEYRADYFASTRDYYELFLDILTRLNNQSPDSEFAARTFRISEEARARSLLELIKETRVNLREGINDDLLERERKLEEELDASARHLSQLMAAGNSSRVAEVNSEMDKLTTEYDEIQAQIRAKNPHYASLTQPQHVSVADVQSQLLDDDSLLLEYMVGDERSYLWVISQVTVKVFELPGRARIEEATRNFYQLLTANQPMAGESFEDRQSRIANAQTRFAEVNNSLSDLVLGPVSDQLGRKRLIIVADGPLQYVPFQTLTIAAANDRPKDSVPGSTQRVPLLVDHEVINEPSASALALVANETGKRQLAPKSVLVFADPVFQPDDPRVTNRPGSQLQSAAGPQQELPEAFRDAGFGDGTRIPELPASREEAEQIISVTPWRSSLEVVGFDASRARIAATDFSQFRIVHFATHGFVDYKHPELSGLVFSLVDEKGQPQNGFLRMHDIYKLKLPVDLVVLSACSTGLGKEVKGEGLIGLTRGFMYAGAGGVVASLWKVDDDATAELMKHFYQGLFQKQLTPAAALREAQLTMLRQTRWQSPYYWAAFVIQGQYDQRVAAPRSWPVKTVAVSAGVLLACAVLMLLLRRRRKGIV